MCSIRSVAVECPLWRLERGGEEREAEGSWGGELVGVEYLSLSNLQ